VVCGHIHKAEIKMIDGVLYCNDGDWVESLTALAEHADGRLEIVHWNEIRSQTPAPPKRLAHQRHENITSATDTSIPETCLP
jgi:hypothetical protein